MPRHKKKYMPVPAPAPVPTPAPSNPERISYAGYEEASKATGISEDELSEAVGKAHRGVLPHQVRAG